MPRQFVLDLGCGYGTNAVRLDVLECAELEDGAVYWEDDFLYRGESRGWEVANFKDALWLIEHISHGRSHRPYLTHYMATLRKRG